MHTNSQNARLAILNPLQSARTRHIDIRYKWVHQKVEHGEIDLRLVKTGDMKADGLTKPLNRQKHKTFVWQLNLAQPPNDIHDAERRKERLEKDIACTRAVVHSNHVVDKSVDKHSF